MFADQQADTSKAFSAFVLQHVGPQEFQVSRRNSNAVAPSALNTQAQIYPEEAAILVSQAKKLEADLSQQTPSKASPLVEPDFEPSPGLHRSLHTPLLQGSVEERPRTTGPCKQKGRLCLRASALLLIWGVAAVLGLAVSCMAQALYGLRAASTTPQSPFDFTLRLAVAPDKCLGSTATQHVVLQACSARASQQFLLLKDGTIRTKSDQRLCITSTHANKLALTLCSESEAQVFEVQPSGKLALKAKPSECVNLLQGDFAAGIVGMYTCSGDLNEVFVYGGGHFLVPILEQELRQVRSLPPLTAGNAGLLLQDLKAICGLSVFAFALSTVLLMATCPNCKHKLLHCLALGFIACMIVLVCCCLFSAKTTIQRADRITEKAKLVASEQTADLDFTLRMTKATHLCLGVWSLQDNAKVGLQQCKANATQQFILKEDGTIRTKTVDGLCITVEPKPNKVTLSPCSAGKSRNQVFSKHAEGQGWLQLHALPSMCLNLLGGDEKAGDIGLYECGHDLNEVFVYSGGNVAISGLALQVHQVRSVLQQEGSHPLENDFAAIFAMGGVGCFLLLAVPSLLLLSCSAKQTSTEVVQNNLP